MISDFFTVNTRTLQARPQSPQNRTKQWEAVQELRDSSNAGQVPAQRKQFELEFRSLARLVIWLDREEELVQLVPEEFKELPVLSKSC
jgi:hypothetical protein